jgi:acyl-CoA synthetase (NDP forming)
LQGIGESVQALSAAATFGRQRARHLAQSGPTAIQITGCPKGTVTLDEWQGKQHLANAGIEVPAGELIDAAEAANAAGRLGYPVVLKLVSTDLPHKTEAGAVLLQLESAAAVAEAAATLQRAARETAVSVPARCLLVEQMVTHPIAELLVGVRNDPQFGHTLTLASGGILAELVSDSATLLLPARREEVAEALHSLRIAALIGGYRKRQAADPERVLDTLCAVISFAAGLGAGLDELEINPLMITSSGCIAADVLLRVEENTL